MPRFGTGTLEVWLLHFCRFTRYHASAMQLFVSLLVSDCVAMSALLSVIFIGCQLNSVSFTKFVLWCMLLTSALHQSQNTSATDLVNSHPRVTLFGWTRMLIDSRSFSVVGPSVWNSLYIYFYICFTDLTECCVHDVLDDDGSIQVSFKKHLFTKFCT